MKKTAVFILSVMCLILAFTGCSDNKNEFSVKSYAADGTQINSISIDVRDREIEVSDSIDNQIHIDYAESSKEYYNIIVSDDNVLTMTMKENKQWTDYIGSKAPADARKISLQIPKMLLSSLALSTTNQDVSLPAVMVSDSLSLSSNGGNILFEKINAGNNISLDSKNGDIKGIIIGSYDDYSISCNIKKGESNLPSKKAGGSKTLSVSANNGDIAIDFCKETD